MSSQEDSGLEPPTTFNDLDLANLTELHWWVRGWLEARGPWFSSRHLMTMDKVLGFLQDLKRNKLLKRKEVDSGL